MSAACPRCGAALTDGGLGVCAACLLEAPLDPVVVGGTVELAEEIGRGGMGSVYRGRHLRLGHTVAVKLLPEALASDPAFRARFEREARALAALRHPNIVAVYDSGEEAGQPYIVMEHVPGGRVSERLPLDVPRAIEVAVQVCDALACAHRAGIVHRDVKPDNLLLDAEGRVKVGDFGIATILGADPRQGRLTASGAAVGTPHYIAPEALAGAAPDPRMDLYSLGVTLYQMVTGRLPVGDFAPPPRVLDRVIRRALAPRPEDRYASAEEMRADLRGALQCATPDEMAPEERTWIRVVALLQSVAAAVAVWALLESIRPKVIGADEVSPLVMMGEERLPGGKFLSRARFETWPTFAAVLALALAAAAYGVLRGHWRRAGLDRACPDRPVAEARWVVVVGVVSCVVYALRKLLEGIGVKAGMYLIPILGGAILFAALYAAWVTVLQSWRVGRPLTRSPLLFVGFALAIVPPTWELFLYLSTWRP